MSVQLALAFGADIKEELPDDDDEEEELPNDDDEAVDVKNGKTKGMKKKNTSNLSRRVPCLHLTYGAFPICRACAFFRYTRVSHKLHCRLRSS